MPEATSKAQFGSGIVRLTNCRLIKETSIVAEDLWFSSTTGKILNGQDLFYQQSVAPEATVDLGERLVAPGFIDVQVNGAFGFDFSAIPKDMATYQKGLHKVNHELLKTGVTSYLPTIPSQLPEVFQRALPYLAPSGATRNASLGCESLGAHCEGPFISPHKSGAHNHRVLRSAPNGLEDLEACYGAENMSTSSSPVRLITLAPELPGVLDAIPELTQRGIAVSIGHSEAGVALGAKAVAKGAAMVTHLFNAMPAPVAREPSFFGLLASLPPSATRASSQCQTRPYFGVVADNIHLHPNTLSLAYRAHPTGCVLVTDSAWPLGLPDDTYSWTNGDSLVKDGAQLTLAGTDKLAGSCTSMIDCVNNLWLSAGTELFEAVATVTKAPAGLLGLQGVKGSLTDGADADLVVLDDKEGKLEVSGVWKFGLRVVG
jgi:N-acetylglucosamine-6-phosphate deacetylase